MPALVRHLRRVNPDVLVSALTHANIVALAARKIAHTPTKVIVAEHANMRYVVGAMGQSRAAAYTLAVRAAYRGADAIVAVSEGTALALAQETKLPLHDITVVPNIVHVDKIREASESPLPFHIHDVPLVVAVGRLTPVKGFDVLIRAFSEVRDKMQAQLVIAGEGEERRALLELVRALGLGEDIQLPGYLANPYALMGRASVVALSSYSEALPTVLLEAFALGVPAVATDCPTGPGELLSSSFGRLVPVGNPSALGEALVEALQGLVATAPDCALDRYRPDTVAGLYRQLVHS